MLPASPLGIYPDIPAEDYHSGAGISKSGLWTLWNQTPYHYRYGEREETEPKKFGTAGHYAVFQPELFEAHFVQGPSDRRGNKWKDAVAKADGDGAKVLTESDYEDVLRLRDTVHRDPTVRRLSKGTLIEHSAYWIDEVTGELCRCRPDGVTPGLKVMTDLKITMGSAAQREWKKRAGEFGYHVQDWTYRWGWFSAGGAPVEAFIFLVVEAKAPFALAIHELPPHAIKEGMDTFRQALDLYHRCKVTDTWPSYPAGPQTCDLPPWAYRINKPA